MQGKYVLAVIPARGGSKGIPGKNIKAFCGKPLIVHSIEAALNCPVVSGTVLSTDDEKIIEISDDVNSSQRSIQNSRNYDY